jgi:cytoplasmic iron level regulating protein YaaA (DUF328/UPF0246 family)
LVVLIIVPPSETKRRPPDVGPPVNLGSLHFPELTVMRRRVLDAVIATSASADAFARLNEKHSMAPEIVRNTWLPDVPTLTAAEVYTGPLHQGLDLAGLTVAARARASRVVVITSPLWGMLRPDDRIPPYRLSLFSRLVGLDRRTDAVWRAVLPDVLASAAGRRGIILDLRSPQSQAIGKPASLDERIVELRVQQRGFGRHIGDVIAKRVRGQAAHLLLESGAEPDRPDDLAVILGEQWQVSLTVPASTDKPSTLTLITDN